MTIEALGALGLWLAVAGGQGTERAHAADAYSRRRLVLAIEDGRSPTPAEIRFLIDRARDESAIGGLALQTRLQVVRAMGRLERREFIPVLAALLDDRRAGDTATFALLLVVRAHSSPEDGEIAAFTNLLLQKTTSPAIIRHVPYTAIQQVLFAERKLLTLVTDPEQYGPVAASLEALARKHRRLYAPADDALDFLRRAVGRSLAGMKPGDHFTPRVALAALMAAGRADREVVRTGFRDRDAQVRRTAIEALNAGGSPIDPSDRVELTRAALDDSSALVRYEALRGWIRHQTPSHGCEPILQALSDSSPHVVLSAIDAMAERCPDDEQMTTRLTVEVTVPPTVGAWQRQSHAFVALAKRAPDRALMAMPGFITHDVWQVRMYAARAAAAMKDVLSLERLAYDAQDNVREATLVPLRTLKGRESDAAVIAALQRRDYQLLRTAALALDGTPPDKYLLEAIVEALERVTAERKDTSRDTRLALLELIRAMGGRDRLPLYQRLLKDFDPRIAAVAAEACTALSTRPCRPDPQRQLRPPPPTPGELTERVKAVIELETGHKIDVILNRELAPLSCARFVRLARAHYYDGLTFHRIVPNFVIQGGSPGANEYVGDGPFMVDELGGSHGRGAVGISTRGRHTGDAQLFVNLVDNPRLDLEYTVFARVSEEDMETVDTIQEGTRISRVNFVPLP